MSAHVIWSGNSIEDFRVWPRPPALPILPNIPANISSLMARCTRDCHHSFFRLKLVTLDAPTTCLINIGGHREKALHSDTLRATKSHRRAAETYLQRHTQAGRDWPVCAAYRSGSVFCKRRPSPWLGQAANRWWYGLLSPAIAFGGVTGGVSTDDRRLLFRPVSLAIRLAGKGRARKALVAADRWRGCGR
jgi:hypothetical protein